MTQNADSVRYQSFLRRIVDELTNQRVFANPLTAEQRVGAAKRLTDVLLASDDGLDLTDDNAVKLAAIIAVGVSDDPAQNDGSGSDT